MNRIESFWNQFEALSTQLQTGPTARYYLVIQGLKLYLQ
jgi:hypothetical protein